MWRIKTRGGKFGNKYVKLDGYTFDSKMEARRYQQLKLLVKAGQIAHLEVHPAFDIMLNYKAICVVELDFSYYCAGRIVYEDVKGADTDLSRLKRKLVEASHDIKVTLIRKV